MQARLSHRRLRVVRIETTVDNQRIVGLLVPNSAVETVLEGSFSISLKHIHVREYAFMFCLHKG